MARHNLRGRSVREQARRILSEATQELTVLDTLPVDSIDLPDRASAAVVYFALKWPSFCCDRD
jgi:hypothetical protein